MEKRQIGDNVQDALSDRDNTFDVYTNCQADAAEAGGTCGFPGILCQEMVGVAKTQGCLGAAKECLSMTEVE